MKKILLILISLLFQCGFGQNIWTNPITDINPSAYDPYIIGDVTDTNILVSGIRRGPDITGEIIPNEYAASGWNNTSISSLKYFEFTLSPQNGYKINFSNFIFNSIASANGPTDFALYSSIDNFEYAIGTVVEGSNLISLSSNLFQNISLPLHLDYTRGMLPMLLELLELKILLLMEM